MDKAQKTERLLSLDILRGFDLFMLVFLHPLLLKIFGHVEQDAVVKFLVYQLDHEAWVGFRVWDLVMPLFLFMTGVAMPFSFANYVEKGGRAAFVLRLLRRFAILFLLGMVVQGNLLSFNLEWFRFYSNTLQAIAVGYLITGISLLAFPLRGQLIFMGTLLLLYWIPMTFYGDLTPEGNFASRVDQLILGRFRDDPSYTWIWSSLTFGVTVMLGALAGQIVRLKVEKVRIAQMLFILGISLTVAGLLLSSQMPIIKRIWTSSMAVYSGGLCFILLAAFYYVIDCKGYSRGLLWLRYYGMNSIVAYMLGEWMNFRSVVHQITFGLERFVGTYYDVVLTFGHVLLIFLLLKAMFRYNIFVKI